MPKTLSLDDLKQLGIVAHTVHRPNDECFKFGCTIHSQSNHHMRDWPVIWRDEWGYFERECEHGIGHPDPDSLGYFERQGSVDIGIHGCDGCCHESGREKSAVREAPSSGVPGTQA